MKQAKIIVSGFVQGVGFRYETKIIARNYKLTGEIENLPDENVRITCEGEKDDIEKFIEAIRNLEKPIAIDDIQIEYSEPTGQYKNFKIIIGDMLNEIVEGHSTEARYLRDILNK